MPFQGLISEQTVKKLAEPSVGPGKPKKVGSFSGLITTPAGTIDPQAISTPISVPTEQQDGGLIGDRPYLRRVLGDASATVGRGLQGMARLLRIGEDIPDLVLAPTFGAATPFVKGLFGESSETAMRQAGASIEGAAEEIYKGGQVQEGFTADVVSGVASLPLFVFGGFATGEDAFRAAKANGASDSDARKLSFAATAVGLALESIGGKGALVDAFLGDVKKEGFKLGMRAVGHFLKGASAEGLTEGAQQVAQEAFAQAYDPDSDVFSMTTFENLALGAADSLIDPSKRRDVIRAATVGATVGGAVRGTIGTTREIFAGERPISGRPVSDEDIEFLNKKEDGVPLIDDQQIAPVELEVDPATGQPFPDQMQTSKVDHIEDPDPRSSEKSDNEIVNERMFAGSMLEIMDAFKRGVAGGPATFKAAYDFWAAPLLERISKQGGEIGPAIAAISRKIADSAAQIRGTYATERLEYMKLARRPKVFRELSRHIPVGSGFHGLIAEQAALDGTADVKLSPAARRAVELKHAMTFKNGQEAERIGVQHITRAGVQPFTADINRRRWLRMASPEFIEMLRAPDSHSAELDILRQALAEGNGGVSQDFITRELDAMAKQDLESRTHVESTRQLDYFPSWIKVGGRVVDILHMDPFAHAEAISTRAALRLGTIEHMGQKLPTDAAKAKIVPRIPEKELALREQVNLASQELKEAKKRGNKAAQDSASKKLVSAERELRRQRLLPTLEITGNSVTQSGKKRGIIEQVGKEFVVKDNKGRIRGRSKVADRNLAAAVLDLSQELPPRMGTAEDFAIVEDPAEPSFVEQLKQEFVSAGGDGSLFDNLMRANQGLPLDAPSSVFRPGTSREQFYRGFRAASSALKALQLTRAFIPNVYEPFGKVPAIAGFPNLMRGYFTFAKATPKVAWGKITGKPYRPLDALIQDMNNLGVVYTDIMNFGFNTSRAMESLARYAQILQVPRIRVDEFNEAVAAYAALRKVGQFMTGKATSLDRERAAILGFSKEETDTLASGFVNASKNLGEVEARKLYSSLARRAVAWSVGTTSMPAELSRAANSRLYKAIVWYDRYAQFTADRLASLGKRTFDSIAEDIRAGNKLGSKQTWDRANLLSQFIVGKQAAGLASLLTIAYLTGGLPELERKFDDATSSFSSFVKEGFLYALGGGPMDMVARAVDRGDTGEFFRSLGPVGALQTAANMFFGAGPFRNLSWDERARKALDLNTPGAKIVYRAMAQMNLIDAYQDDSFAAARKAYYSWTRDNQPSNVSPVSTTPEIDREIGMALARAKSEIDRGGDPRKIQQHLNDAVLARIATETPLSAAKGVEPADRIASAIRGKRLLPQIDPRLWPEFYERVGPDRVRALATHDIILGQWADSISGKASTDSDTEAFLWNLANPDSGSPAALDRRTGIHKAPESGQRAERIRDIAMRKMDDVFPAGGLSMLVNHEGVSRTSYVDLLGNPTIGVGHHLDGSFRSRHNIKATGTDASYEDLLAGRRHLEPDQIGKLANLDMQDARSGARKIFKNYDRFNPDVRSALTNFVFNVGEASARSFKDFVSIMNSDSPDRQAAYNAMMQSKWAGQVGKRAEDIAGIIKGSLTVSDVNRRFVGNREAQSPQG